MNLYLYIKVIFRNTRIHRNQSFRNLLLNLSEEKGGQPPSVGKEMKFLKNFMTMNEE